MLALACWRHIHEMFRMTRQTALRNALHCHSNLNDSIALPEAVWHQIRIYTSVWVCAWHWMCWVVCAQLNWSSSFSNNSVENVNSKYLLWATEVYELWHTHIRIRSSKEARGREHAFVTVLCIFGFHSKSHRKIIVGNGQQLQIAKFSE